MRWRRDRDHRTALVHLLGLVAGLAACLHLAAVSWAQAGGRSAGSCGPASICRYSSSSPGTCSTPSPWPRRSSCSPSWAGRRPAGRGFRGGLGGPAGCRVAAGDAGPALVLLSRYLLPTVAAWAICPGPGIVFGFQVLQRHGHPGNLVVGRGAGTAAIGHDRAADRAATAADHTPGHRYRRPGLLGGRKGLVAAGGGCHDVLPRHHRDPAPQEIRAATVRRPRTETRRSSMSGSRRLSRSRWTDRTAR